MEAKAQKWWPRVGKPQIPWVLRFLNEGGEFWVEKNSPSPRFYVFWCRDARPGELSSPRRANPVHFFL